MNNGVITGNLDTVSEEIPSAAHANGPDIGDRTLSILEAQTMVFGHDVERVHALVSERAKTYGALVKGLREEWPEREELDRFLAFVGLEKNGKSRYAAFIRLAQLREDPLRNFLANASLPQEKQDDVLAKAFDYVENRALSEQDRMLEKVEQEDLLSPFYRTLLRGANETGKAFGNWFRAWNRELVWGVNRQLEAQFENDSAAIMAYLQEENLLDRGHGGEIADRSYSILRDTGSRYQKLAYADAFPKEIQAIVTSIQNLRTSLDHLEDLHYGQKVAYQNYFQALETAFLETDTDRLVERWAEVDVAWMSVTGPIQITHPLEYYEDHYRKAVAPEWDVRLRNDHLFESVAHKDVKATFRALCAKEGIGEDSNMFRYSLASLDRVQLYTSSPLFYYGAFLCGLPSAQVVPNDAVVSELHGKKIYSFAENVLKQRRTQPKTLLRKFAFSPSLLEKARALLWGPNELWFRAYDVDTIGHELGHTLGMDRDTESKMNVTGNFKNIEEWKATTGGLVAFLLNPQEDLKEALITKIVDRTVSMLSWMKIGDNVTYYCEALIHLELLFESGVLVLDSEGRADMNLAPETFERLKDIYVRTYRRLLRSYYGQEDASDFLGEFTVRENGFFLPKDEKARAFVEKYYSLYEEYGNAVDPNA